MNIMMTNNNYQPATPFSDNGSPNESRESIPKYFNNGDMMIDNINYNNNLKSSNIANMDEEMNKDIFNETYKREYHLKDIMLTPQTSPQHNQTQFPPFQQSPSQGDNNDEHHYFQQFEPQVTESKNLINEHQQFHQQLQKQLQQQLQQHHQLNQRQVQNPHPTQSTPPPHPLPQVQTPQTFDENRLTNNETNNLQDDEPQAPNNVLILKRYRIGKEIGKGAFGLVHYCTDQHYPEENLAIKLEEPSATKQILKTEMAILKTVQGPGVVKLVKSGRFVIGDSDKIWSYAIMELLGPNLTQCRKQMKNGMFPPEIVVEYVGQVLYTLLYIHSKGVTHRDIKPANMCLSENGVVLVDFGLARKHLTKGQIRPERHLVGFRGTSRYASLRAHEGKDLGPVDDLWSLFYVTVEFLQGSLPWRSKERDEIFMMKKKELLGIPPCLKGFSDYLKTLSYGDPIDYVRLSILISNITAECRDIILETPYLDDTPEDEDDIDINNMNINQPMILKDEKQHENNGNAALIEEERSNDSKKNKPFGKLHLHLHSSNNSLNEENDKNHIVSSNSKYVNSNNSGSNSGGGGHTGLLALLSRSRRDVPAAESN